tara:strand:+ start:593 stop:799 length:207 start_codon:yes stop_codon:yes gene_type:complete
MPIDPGDVKPIDFGATWEEKAKYWMGAWVRGERAYTKLCKRLIKLEQELREEKENNRSEVEEEVLGCA